MTDDLDSVDRCLVQPFNLHEADLMVAETVAERALAAAADHVLVVHVVLCVGHACGRAHGRVAVVDGRYLDANERAWFAAHVANLQPSSEHLLHLV
jgi:hypothetical protein